MQHIVTLVEMENALGGWYLLAQSTSEHKALYAEVGRRRFKVTRGNESVEAGLFSTAIECYNYGWKRHGQED